MSNTICAFVFFRTDKISMLNFRQLLYDFFKQDVRSFFEVLNSCASTFECPAFNLECLIFEFMTSGH